MAELYYYNKYNIVNIFSDTVEVCDDERANYILADDKKTLSNGDNWFRNYRLDTKTNEYIGIDPIPLPVKFSDVVGNYSVYSRADSKYPTLNYTEVSRIDRFVEVYENGSMWLVHFKEYELKRDFVRKEKGSLISKNIIGTASQYPSDGIQGGYWYVRQGLVNTAPTTPSSIAVPSTIKGGENTNISWGASTDQDGNLSGYILERSVNGGSFTQIYKGSNRSFTDTITKGWNTVAYRVKAYDSEGEESGYRTSSTRDIINNTPPTISGQDQDLGDKNLGFLITYKVNDIDTSDTLVVTEKLNGSIIQTINGAPRNQDLEIEITNEKLFSLPLNSTNTIEIKVDDQNGGIAYRRYTFRRTNTAPIISGKDKDLGQATRPFGVNFSVTDNEGNSITVKTYLNDVLKKEYKAKDGANYAFTLSKDDWFKLPIGQHSIKIEAIDEHGATAVRNYTFERYDDRIQFTLKAPIETDIMATKILVTPAWTIPKGAVTKIEACNNAYDEVPTWEDITSQVNISRHYNFTNATKTTDKWGIDIRFTIEKGTATEQCIVNGFGGAFE